MSRRHADNWSHPGHYLVDLYTWPWWLNGHGHGHEWPTATPLMCNVNRPSHSEIQLFQNLTMKIHGQDHVRGQKVKVTFDLQNSKVKVKPTGHIWGLEFNRYVCFSFPGNRTTFGWDVRNSISDLENSRSRSWPKSNLMVTFDALAFNRYVCFSFHGNQTIFGWDIANCIFDLKIHGQGHTWWSHLSPRVQSICLLFVSWQLDHFWLRYSKLYIWPWKFKVKVIAKVKPDGHIWALEFNQYVCFSFRGNRTIFGWDIANPIFDLE